LPNERDERRLFEVLPPPPGGLARLRSRIHREERRRTRTWRLAGATTGLAVVALAILLALTFDARRARRLDPGSDLLTIRLGHAAAPAEPVSIPPEYRHEFAVRRIPTTDERVVFYLVGSR
jgi:hypothetical protein